MKRFVIGALGAALALEAVWRWGRRDGYAHGFVIGRRMAG